MNTLKKKKKKKNA